MLLEYLLKINYLFQILQEKKYRNISTRTVLIRLVVETSLI